MRRQSLAASSSFADQGRGGGEAHRQSPLTGGQAQTQGDVGLAGAAVADGDDVLAPFDVFAPGQLHDQRPVHRSSGREVEGVQGLDSWSGRRGYGAGPSAGDGSWPILTIGRTVFEVWLGDL